MSQLFLKEQQVDLARRLDEAQASMNEGQGCEVVKVIASLIRIGMINDAKDMVLLDWNRFESLPVVGELLAKELVAEEIRQFTRFRIKIEEE